jgi:hypothetical protein
MDEGTFHALSLEADTRSRIEPERAAYWEGYRRGLQRAHFGARFGTPEAHALYLTLAASRVPERAARGRGYRDGLAAGEPRKSA